MSLRGLILDPLKLINASVKSTRTSNLQAAYWFQGFQVGWMRGVLIYDTSFSLSLSVVWDACPVLSPVPAPDPPSTSETKCRVRSTPSQKKITRVIALVSIHSRHLDIPFLCGNYSATIATPLWRVTQWKDQKINKELTAHHDDHPLASSWVVVKKWMSHSRHRALGTTRPRQSFGPDPYFQVI